jgi:acetylornithine/succinyldiaminopimelate/putrescine aminotransferase
VTERGEYLSKKLRALSVKYPEIEEIRGRGLLIGVQVKGDPLAIIARCKELGLLLIKAEHHTIRFLPPLIVSRKLIDTAVAIFEKALKGCTAVAQPW